MGASRSAGERTGKHTGAGAERRAEGRWQRAGSATPKREWLATLLVAGRTTASDQPRGAECRAGGRCQRA
jgi:hypothetical protein